MPADVSQVDVELEGSGAASMPHEDPGAGRLALHRLLDAQLLCHMLFLLFLGSAFVRLVGFNAVSVWGMFCTYVLTEHLLGSAILVLLATRSLLRHSELLPPRVVRQVLGIAMCTLVSATLTVSATTWLHPHLMPPSRDIEEWVLHFGLNVHSAWVVGVSPVPDLTGGFFAGLLVVPIAAQLAYCTSQDVQRYYALGATTTVMIGVACSAATAITLAVVWRSRGARAGCHARRSEGVPTSSELPTDPQGPAAHLPARARRGQKPRATCLATMLCAFISFALATAFLLLLGYCGFKSRPVLLRLFPEGDYDVEVFDAAKQESFRGKVAIQGSVVQFTEPATPREVRALRRLTGKDGGGNSSATGNASNKSADVNRTKIVILDADRDRKFLVIPPRLNNGSSNQSKTDKGICLFAHLDVDMSKAIKSPTIQFVAKRVSENDTAVDSYSTGEHDIDVYRSKGQEGRTNLITINSAAGDRLTLKQTKESTGWVRVTELTCMEYSEDEGEEGGEVEAKVNTSELVNTTGFECSTEEFEAGDDDDAEAGQVAKELEETMPLAAEGPEGDDDPVNATALALANASAGRSLLDLGRFYGQHCGADNDAFKDGLCTTRNWWQCYRQRPPVDYLDRACFWHDYCLQVYQRPGWIWPAGLCLPQGNRCKCDFYFTWMVYWARFRCAPRCTAAATAIHATFQGLLSCWFPLKICWWIPHFSCGCRSCSCPRLYWRRVCIHLGNWCAPLGSGEVPF